MSRATDLLEQMGCDGDCPGEYILKLWEREHTLKGELILKNTGIRALEAKVAELEERESNALQAECTIARQFFEIQDLAISHKARAEVAEARVKFLEDQRERWLRDIEDILG